MKEVTLVGLLCLFLLKLCLKRCLDLLKISKLCTILWRLV